MKSMLSTYIKLSYLFLHGTNVFFVMYTLYNGQYKIIIDYSVIRNESGK